MTDANRLDSLRALRIEGNIAYVPLTKGYEAVIDTADVALVEGFNWVAMVSPHTVYAYRTSPSPKRRAILMHRVLLGEPEGLVDHRNGDGLDNRRDNLREANTSQNCHNQKVTSRNTSGVKGVCWNKSRGKWQASVMAYGKRKTLRFATKEAASAWAEQERKRLHGEFASPAVLAALIAQEAE